MNSSRPAAVIVLAAGEGKRMRSALPKVLHQLAGRSLLGHILAAATSLEPDHTVVVVRHGRDQVAAHATELVPDAIVADQDDIPGTGRAVQCALVALDAAAPGLTGPIVVTTGDCPLLDAASLAQLIGAHLTDGNAITILTAVVDDATGYGRILREAATGQVTGIVEHRDASPAQRLISEINASVYVFDADLLRRGLGELGRANDQGEVYLTDLVALARQGGGKVGALITPDPWTVRGINDRVQLAETAAELNRRLVTEAMLAGVTIIDPASTWIDVGVELAQDVTLLPGTHLAGATRIASGAVVGPETSLIDTTVESGATVTRTYSNGAVIGPGASVGPYTHLRPGTVLGPRGKIGSFSEVKNAQIGAGSKVPHLSYVGDAVVGQNSNIGAATIVANYDGVAKHATVIGSGVRIGSDTVLVAPVTIGDGAFTGAGSIIRGDVPAGSLAVSSPPQRIIEGWTVAKRPGSVSAQAAADAAASLDAADVVGDGGSVDVGAAAAAHAAAADAASATAASIDSAASAGPAPLTSSSKSAADVREGESP